MALRDQAGDDVDPDDFTNLFLNLSMVIIL